MLLFDRRRADAAGTATSAAAVAAMRYLGRVVDFMVVMGEDDEGFNRAGGIVYFMVLLTFEAMNFVSRLDSLQKNNLLATQARLQILIEFSELATILR